MEIHIPTLRHRCLQSKESLIADFLKTKGGNIKHELLSGLHIAHLNKGEHVKVLGVSHIDTVRSDLHFQAVIANKKEMIIHNTELDDRLGVYIILDLLPSIGVECDVLLTDGEESGNTTAANFNNQKEYNWIFSFDRRGNDVVMYCYEDQKSKELLTRYGFTNGTGSFSCIARMQYLGVKGFNFGCGYHDEHQLKCYASMRELYNQIKLFRTFWNAMKNEKLSHERATYRHGSNGGGGTQRIHPSDYTEGDESFFGGRGLDGSAQYSHGQEWLEGEWELLSAKTSTGKVVKRGCSNRKCHDVSCADPCPKSVII